MEFLQLRISMLKQMFFSLFLLLNLAINPAFAQTAPADYDKQCTTSYQQKTYWWGTATCQATNIYGTYPISQISLLSHKNEKRTVTIARQLYPNDSRSGLVCDAVYPQSTTVSEPIETCTYQPRQPFTSISLDAVTCENGNLVGTVNWSMGPGESFEIQTRTGSGGNFSGWAKASWITYSGATVTLSGTPYGSQDQHLDFRIRLSGNGKTGSWSNEARMSGNCWNVDSQ